MLRPILFTIFVIKVAIGQGCDPDPCVNGKCSPNAGDGWTYTCTCDRYWAGRHCDLPQPEVICGNKSIEIFIDKRIVTEQELEESPEFVHFMNAPGCSAVEKGGGYYLKVDAPFTTCEVVITHSGDEYTFTQQIVWNRLVEFVERPTVLLDFKCTYQDKYTVTFGEITPLVTAVDFETSYGVFKVDMSLYKDSDFDEKYGTRPVVTIKDEVCVSTELVKNVMPDDLVLTNRECWASTKRDGSGESHYLVSEKCKDDPTTDILSNGESDFARFCFQMFKWKDIMDEVYVHCIINVCNATAYSDYCTCQDERTKRFARSVTPDESGARITYGPVYVKEIGWNENGLTDDVIIFENDKQNQNPDNKRKGYSSADSKTTILIAVGVVLVIALILLGVVVAVYINCKRRSRDLKNELGGEVERVVIPNPMAHDAMIH